MTTAAEKTSDASIYNRGDKFTPQGVDGYHENWYPICLSSDVGKEEVKGFDFLNGRIIVYRKRDGSAHVMSAFCRHLGVDLSVGKVVGDHVRCPYHHWEYDETGACVKNAVGDPVPPRARLFKFPTAENLGLIWAYNGETPAYEAPVFEVPETDLTFSAIRSVELPMDSFMLYSNALDIQHLISVHGIKFKKKPDNFDTTGRTIAYEQHQVIPGIGETMQHVKLIGTNCIQISNKIMGRQTYMMSCGLLVRGPLTKTFNVTATPKSTGKPGEDQMIVQHIKMVENFGLQLNAEDDPVMRTVSPRLDNLSASDNTLAMYFRFAKAYPRSNVAEDMIRNDYMDGARKV
jgi:nitrite reductase/ring-hydroxylating ferredoxin subunit